MLIINKKNERKFEAKIIKNYLPDGNLSNYLYLLLDGDYRAIHWTTWVRVFGQKNSVYD